MTTIDQFDRQILDIMEKDSHQTGHSLAEKVGLSSTACLRRLQRLRKEGVIEREVAILAPEYRSHGATQVVVLLTIKRHNPKRIETLTRKFRRMSEVQRVFSVTGDEDIVLLMGCASMEAFADFADTHFYEPPVEGFQTLVVLREFV